MIERWCLWDGSHQWKSFILGVHPSFFIIPGGWTKNSIWGFIWQFISLPGVCPPCLVYQGFIHFFFHTWNIYFSWFSGDLIDFFAIPGVYQIFLQYLGFIWFVPIPGVYQNFPRYRGCIGFSLDTRGLSGFSSIPGDHQFFFRYMGFIQFYLYIPGVYP